MLLIGIARFRRRMMMSREIAGQGKDLDQRQRDFVGNDVSIPIGIWKRFRNLVVEISTIVVEW